MPPLQTPDRNARPGYLSRLWLVITQRAVNSSLGEQSSVAKPSRVAKGTLQLPWQKIPWSNAQPQSATSGKLHAEVFASSKVSPHIPKEKKSKAVIKPSLSFRGGFLLCKANFPLVLAEPGCGGKGLTFPPCPRRAARSGGL